MSKRPTALIISVGFDAHAGDPTANLAVDRDAFAGAGRAIAGAGLPVLLVQEGGYIVERLADNLSAFLDGLGVS
jgi:acetoin utilization deacetylase AcuC-like enzyme